MNFAGLPPTTDHGSTFLKTAARAPTTAPAPIVTPMPTNASAPIQARSPRVIGAVISSWSGEVMSCDAVHRNAP